MKTPIEYEKVDFPPPMTTLRPDQEVCYKEMMEKIDPALPCNTLFGHIYTGFGKTRMFLFIAITMKVPILVVYNSNTIMTGWINEVRDSLGIEVNVAGNELGRHPVTIASIQRCVHHHYGRDQYKYYGVVILDEADCYCTQLSMNEIVDMYPKMLLGCSATVDRPDGLDRALDILWGPRNGGTWVKRIKYFDEKSSLELHLLHTSYTIDYIYNHTGKMNWGMMIDTSCSIEERNILIRNLVLLHADKKMLILCKKKSHTETLHQMLVDVGEDVSIFYSTLGGYYDAHVLIATCSKAGRGYDDAQVSSAYDNRRFDMLIMTTTLKDTTQALGRTLRGDHLLCYILVDNNPTMKKHALDMASSNRKRGAVIVEEHV